MQNLISAQSHVNDWMQRQGARLVLLHQGRRQIIENAFDPLPRVLSGREFTHLEQGLIQRINALNLFLNDIYNDRMILRDGVIPEEFVYASPDFRPECMNLRPIKGLYAHITATDLIRTKDGVWYALEDTLSVPDGITLTHAARKLTRELSPETYAVPTLCDNCGLDILLSQLYRDILEGDPALTEGIVVVLKEGEDSATGFELSYMASLTGAVVAEAGELIVMDNKVYYRSPTGGFQRVSILHRLALDRQLDPLCFDENIGVPHLMEVYAAGNIAILNAPGCSVAEDRGLGCFVPEIIRYYLDEEPILPGVPTYLPWYPDQREYILSHMDSLMFKDVSSDQRMATFRGNMISDEEKAALARQIQADPRRFIAQEILEVEEVPIFSPDGTQKTARCDLRAYTVHSDSIRVWMGGLTRFTLREEGKEPVSGFQDTWVMSE